MPHHHLVDMEFTASVLKPCQAPDCIIDSLPNPGNNDKQPLPRGRRPNLKLLLWHASQTAEALLGLRAGQCPTSALSQPFVKALARHNLIPVLRRTLPSMSSG